MPEHITVFASLKPHINVAENTQYIMKNVW